MSVQSSTNHRPVSFFCNYCLCELKLFEDVPTSGGRFRKHFWTNCQHVLCSACRQRFPSQCAVCKKSCQFKEINRNIGDNYRPFFEPTAKLRQNLIGVIRFQRAQTELIVSRMEAHSRAIQRKCAEFKQMHQKAHETYQQSGAEHRKVKIMFKIIGNEKLRQQARRQQHQQQQQQQQQHRHPQRTDNYRQHTKRYNSPKRRSSRLRSDPHHRPTEYRQSNWNGRGQKNQPNPNWSRSFSVGLASPHPGINNRQQPVNPAMGDSVGFSDPIHEFSTP